MPVNFKMVPKQNNISIPPQIKYYPCAVSKGTLDLEQVADIISSRSSLTPGDCYGVLISMSAVIGEALAEGKIVKIDSLGTFALTLTGTGADSPEPIGKSNIKMAKIVYKPSKRLKKILSTLAFKRIY